MGQLELKTVEPPTTHMPERTPVPENRDASSPSGRTPFFQGDDHLNRMLDSLFRMGFHPVRSDDQMVGSLSWSIDMSTKGYRVQEYRAENVREIVRSVDMASGKEELISTDPMDVSLIIVRDATGRIVDAYLIRRIIHRYRTGETDRTTIIERFVRNPK